MSNPISKVLVNAEGPLIHCKINENETARESGNEFAFYILKDEKRIHVKWYSKINSYCFDSRGEPGYYRIVGFIKTKDSLVHSLKSIPIFLNPVEANSENLSTIDDKKSTYQLITHNWRFPALYFPGRSDRLFILLPSAVDRTKMKLPAFSRWTWALKNLFPGEVLCIADPTLEQEDNLRLGWCVGNEKNDANSELAGIIKSFAKIRGIPNENITIWGSSAGGFSALALAAHISGATAVAINAQTDALSYEMQSQVDLFRKTCFNNQSIEEIRGKYAHRVDMTQLWRTVKSSRAILIQNETDVHHYITHFNPLCAALGGKPKYGINKIDNHIAWIYSDANGHTPETEQMATEIISLIFNK